MRGGRGRMRFGLNQQGMSLTETVVSLGLLALSAATTGDFLIHQARANSANYGYTTAYGLAAQEIEDLRALDYDDIGSRASTHDDGAIRFTVTTTALADTPETNMKQITVDVAWSEPTGDQHVTLQTIYTSIRR